MAYKWMNSPTKNAKFEIWIYAKIRVGVIQMRLKYLEIMIAVLLGILIPSLLVWMLQDRVLPVVNKNEFDMSEASAPIPKQTISVSFGDGDVREIPFEEYILSVVLSEMPADFESEALKAQAVVARTYALRRVNKNEKHLDAVVCTSSSCCQGYCSVQEYLNRGGDEESIVKVQSAVEATTGQVLVYNGDLIDATYFSCSGGVTEDAVSVWGRDLPYLRSVQSPGEESAKHFVDTIQFSTEHLMNRLGIENQQLKIGEITHTNGGGVETINICNVVFTGTELRKKLGLRSTAFYISIIGNTVTITTKGYGHRVGMSQYGADAMAINGATYQEILRHYYQGVSLIQYEFD